MEVKVRGEREDTDWSAEGHGECNRLLPVWSPLLLPGGEVCVFLPLGSPSPCAEGHSDGGTGHSGSGAAV